MRASLPRSARPRGRPGRIQARPPRRRVRRWRVGPRARAAAARRAAAAGAHREAAEQYARALRYAESLGKAECAKLWSAYAYAAELTGQAADAIEARLEATVRTRGEAAAAAAELGPLQET